MAINFIHSVKSTIMKVDFNKYSDHLVPAVIQDHSTHKVLMLGFMNEEALNKTMQEGRVTFFSRTKKRLWTKGEESGNFLLVREIAADCDQDTLLIKAEPLGPVCHTGADTCWSERNHPDDFLYYLEDIIELRKKSEQGRSYVRELFQKGVPKIAQKVGEEAVEMVIESLGNQDDLFLNESADLLFHYLVLLNAKGYNLRSVIEVLKQRHSK